MKTLLELARMAGLGNAAGVELRNKLGNARRRAAWRKAILKNATPEERHIADFARDYSGSDFGVLCEIAARHAA